MLSSRRAGGCGEGGRGLRGGFRVGGPRLGELLVGCQREVRERWLGAQAKREVITNTTLLRIMKYILNWECNNRNQVDIGRKGGMRPTQAHSSHQANSLQYNPQSRASHSRDHRGYLGAVICCEYVCCASSPSRCFVHASCGTIANVIALVIQGAWRYA
jgi:hypothetical protein